MYKMNYYNEKILNIISDNILNYNVNELKDIYEIFNSGETKLIPSSKTKNIYNNFLIEEGVINKQFDLPYYFDFKKAKTIMIIGMDPKGSHNHKDIILNTPYSIQSATENSMNENDYWKIINILGNSYNIYLTDVYKAYFLKGSIASNKNILYKKKNLHAEIIRNEILEVKPYAILCWGKVSRDFVARVVKLKLLNIITKDVNYPYECKGDFNDIRLVAIPHPSGSTHEESFVSFHEANLPNIPYSKKIRPETLANFVLSKLK